MCGSCGERKRSLTRLPGGTGQTTESVRPKPRLSASTAPWRKLPRNSAASLSIVTLPCRKRDLLSKISLPTHRTTVTVSWTSTTIPPPHSSTSRNSFSGWRTELPGGWQHKTVTNRLGRYQDVTSINDADVASGGQHRHR